MQIQLNILEKTVYAQPKCVLNLHLICPPKSAS